MGWIQTKKLFLSKGNKNVKGEHTDWEKNLSPHTSDRPLISKVYKELKKIYTQNIKNPINKWAKEWADTSQKKIYR